MELIVSMLTKLGKIILLQPFELKRTRWNRRWDSIAVEKKLQLESIVRINL
jgi:hypothetical protein